MGKVKQNPSDLTIGLGDDLTPGEFVGAVRNFFGYIAEVARAQGEAASGIRWTVRVRAGSSLIGVEPNADAPRAAVKQVYAEVGRGLQLVKNGELDRGTWFLGVGLPKEAFINLERLSVLAKKHPDGDGVRIWIGRKAVAIGPEVAERIRIMGRQ